MGNVKSSMSIEIHCSVCKEVLPRNGAEVTSNTAIIYVNPSACKCKSQIDCGLIFVDADAVAAYCNALRAKIKDLEERVYTCPNCGLRSNEYEPEPEPDSETTTLVELKP